MRVRITETVFAELQEIRVFIAQKNKEAAQAVVFRIEQVIARIGVFPNMAYPVEKSDIRIFPARPFPFLIFYTVGKDEVIIRNVRYSGRQRPKKGR